jgi:hypothetical protein
MAGNGTSYLKGHLEHRRTESDYLGVMLEAVTLEDWRSVVTAAVTAAKAGDPTARSWLAQYLVGKPAASAPAPLTVVVQQLSGCDPLVEKLAAPHIDRLEYPALHEDDRRDDAVRELVANELRKLEVNSRGTEGSGNAVGDEAFSAETPLVTRQLVT